MVNFVHLHVAVLHVAVVCDWYPVAKWLHDVVLQSGHVPSQVVPPLFVHPVKLSCPFVYRYDGLPLYPVAQLKVPLAMPQTQLNVPLLLLTAIGPRLIVPLYPVGMVVTLPVGHTVEEQMDDVHVLSGVPHAASGTIMHIGVVVSA